MRLHCNTICAKVKLKCLLWSINLIELVAYVLHATKASIR